MLCVKPGQAIPSLAQGLREALQLRVIDESHAIGDLLRACDLHSLALLQCLHECCGIVGEGDAIPADEIGADRERLGEPSRAARNRISLQRYSRR
jgi:hypothetical protein